MKKVLLFVCCKKYYFSCPRLHCIFEYPWHVAASNVKGCRGAGLGDRLPISRKKRNGNLRDVGREGGREGWGEGGTEGGTELYMYNVYREKEKWWPEQARRLR